MQISDNTPFDEIVKKESKFLAKEDVGQHGLIVTIAGFSRDKVGDDDKTIMHFIENLKPMVLNKTNSNLVKILTGATNAGEAKGKKVVVYNDPTVDYQGQIVGGLRIKSVNQAEPEQAPPVASEPPHTAADDIPF